MTSLRIFQGLRQTHRDRQAALASKIALLARLDDAAHADHAWQDLYARPEWHAKVTHGRHCGVCKRRLGRHDAVCPHCAARWQESPTTRHRMRYWLFGLGAMVIAVAVGGVCRNAFLSFVAHSAAADPDRALNPDFVDFVDSYVWVFITVVVLMLSTYLFELLDLAPNGDWLPPAQVPQKVR